MELFDLSTIITIAIAVFVFLRLRSVLGTRTGHEKPPMQRRNGSGQPLPGDLDDVSNDNVVTLPNRRKTTADEDQDDQILVAINTIAKPRTKLNKALKSVYEADPRFDPGQFTNGANMAYEMIVTAFADGDKKTLKNLLSREVYEGFSGAIDEREKNGETIKASFVGIDSSKIVEAELIKQEAQITVRFVSEIVSATYDSKNDLIDGDPDQVAEVIDIWTFARDTRSKDPNWKLVATESGN